MTTALEEARKLAGANYQQLLQSKKFALTRLLDADRDIRCAAIIVCESYWKCTAEQEYVGICCEIALHDTEDCVRTHAICTLGRAFEASHHGSISALLAKIATSNGNSNEVRSAAYWSVRQIQIGLDLTDNIRMLISTLPLASREKEDVKTNITRLAQANNIDLSSVGEIDLEYVRRYLS